MEIWHLDEPVKVYNFTVEDNHTYFVGDSGVWVHNNCVDPDVSRTNHNYKHFPEKSKSWKNIIKSTKNGPAKYSKDIKNIEAFEREAWRNGNPVINGKNWKVKVYDRIIGASNGKETMYVRIENSSNVIHGHPIPKSEYVKLLGKR